MPMRKQLRKHGRVDIEKAITRMGGFRRIAFLMNLSLAYKHRKPKGYWDNLENLQDEVSFLPPSPTFCKTKCLDLCIIPFNGLYLFTFFSSLKTNLQCFRLVASRGAGEWIHLICPAENLLNEQVGAFGNLSYKQCLKKKCSSVTGDFASLFIRTLINNAVFLRC